jgi:hypothetical protein
VAVLQIRLAALSTVSVYSVLIKVELYAVEKRVLKHGSVEVARSAKRYHQRKRVVSPTHPSVAAFARVTSTADQVSGVPNTVEDEVRPLTGLRQHVPSHATTIMSACSSLQQQWFRRARATPGSSAKPTRIRNACARELQV